MKFLKLLQVVAICTGLLGLGGAKAAVVTFSSVGNTQSILYSITQDGATLSSTMKFTLNVLTPTSATFGLLVKNDSTGPGQNVLMSFGIDVVSPTLTGASTTGGVWDAGINDTLPTFQSVDLCLWRSNGCSGGAIGNGLGEGLSDTFSLILTTAGNFTTSGISFTSPYGVKFQDVGSGGQSFEFAGCNVGTPGCGGTVVIQAIPEPASVTLLGLGLLGVALARRRQRT